MVACSSCSLGNIQRKCWVLFTTAQQLNKSHMTELKSKVYSEFISLCVFAVRMVQVDVWLLFCFVFLHKMFNQCERGQTEANAVQSGSHTHVHLCVCVCRPLSDCSLWVGWCERRASSVSMSLPLHELSSFLCRSGEVSRNSVTDRKSRLKKNKRRSSLYDVRCMMTHNVWNLSLTAFVSPSCVNMSIPASCSRIRLLSLTWTR